MTADSKVMRNRKRVAAQYRKRVASGKCAWHGCRNRARHDRVMCTKHGARQNAAAKLRHAMRQAELEGLKLLLERMAT